MQACIMERGWIDSDSFLWNVGGREVYKIIRGMVKVNTHSGLSRRENVKGTQA